MDDSCPSHHGNLSLYLVSTKFQSVVDKVELSSNSALAGAQTCPGNPRHTTTHHLQLAYQVLCSNLEAFLRKIMETKFVSYHLRKIRVPKNVWVVTG